MRKLNREIGSLISEKSEYVPSHKQTPNHSREELIQPEDVGVHNSDDSGNEDKDESSLDRSKEIEFVTISQINKSSTPEMADIG